MREQLGTKQDLAELLALSERQITRLVGSGVLPKRQGTRGYALAPCVKAYLAFLRSKSGSLTSERARLTKAQADLAELKLRLRTGELVERRAIEQERFHQGREVRDGLNNIPDRVSGPCAAESDQQKIHALLSKEILQTLEALSDEHTPDPSPDRGPDAARPHPAPRRTAPFTDRPRRSA